MGNGQETGNPHRRRIINNGADIPRFHITNEQDYTFEHSQSASQRNHRVEKKNQAISQDSLEDQNGNSFEDKEHLGSIPLEIDMECEMEGNIQDQIIVRQMTKSRHVPTIRHSLVAERKRSLITSNRV